jgi:hypothetical protein
MEALPIVPRAARVPAGPEGPIVFDPPTDQEWGAGRGNRTPTPLRAPDFELNPGAGLWAPMSPKGNFRRSKPPGGATEALSDALSDAWWPIGRPRFGQSGGGPSHAPSRSVSGTFPRMPIRNIFAAGCVPASSGAARMGKLRAASPPDRANLKAHQGSRRMKPAPASVTRRLNTAHREARAALATSSIPSVGQGLPADPRGTKTAVPMSLRD